MSALTGTWYSARLWFMNRPKAWSSTLSSSRAEPIPHTIPPSTRLLAVLGLMTRPLATAVTTRGTRIAPRSSSTFTSAKIAECVSIHRGNSQEFFTDEGDTDRGISSGVVERPVDIGSYDTL